MRFALSGFEMRFAQFFFLLFADCVRVRDVRCVVRRVEARVEARVEEIFNNYAHGMNAWFEEGEFMITITTGGGGPATRVTLGEDGLIKEWHQNWGTPWRVVGNHANHNIVFCHDEDTQDNFGMTSDEDLEVLERDDDIISRENVHVLECDDQLELLDPERNARERLCVEAVENDESSDGSSSDQEPVPVPAQQQEPPVPAQQLTHTWWVGQTAQQQEPPAAQQQPPRTCSCCGQRGRNKRTCGEDGHPCLRGACA